MLWDILLKAGKSAANVITGSREAQARINEKEVDGAPPSRLRLWRSFLGWTCAICFVWEVVARPIVTTYWPGATLPPSFLKEVTSLLLSLLGL